MEESKRFQSLGTQHSRRVIKVLSRKTFPQSSRLSRFPADVTNKNRTQSPADSAVNQSGGYFQNFENSQKFE